MSLDWQIVFHLNYFLWKLEKCFQDSILGLHRWYFKNNNFMLWVINELNVVSVDGFFKNIKQIMF
jgi:hypothetical protein